MRKTKGIILVLTIVTFVLLSCKDDNNQKYGEGYDPSKSIKLGSFEPDSDGMATKVLLKGENFGNDPKIVKVYFNDKRAAVVGASGSHLYVMAPRQPGDTCDVSVVIGKDSVIYDSQFRYKTMITVTTLAGQKGTTEFKGGTLSEATFDHPSTLCVDGEGNIFVSHWRVPYCFVMINQEKDIVQAVLPGGFEVKYALGAPTADADGKVIMAPTDDGDGFYSFDPDAQWSPKVRSVLHPTEEEQAAGMDDFTLDWKHGMASCKKDGYIYTRSLGGQLVKFHPVTRKGQRVAYGIQNGSGSCLLFHPEQENLLYIVCTHSHAIYTYDIDTDKLELYAGSPGESGWRDGRRLEAEFNSPYQLVIDSDGSILIADEGNHCIRKITPDGMVSTLIGKGGVAGYQDGNPEDALFNKPRGVAIDKEGVVYIADYENNCIRKLAIE